MSNLNESLKKTIDSLDLDRRLDQVSKLAQKALGDAKEQVGTLAHDNRDKVDGWVDKATAAINEKTDGKYRDKVAKFGVAARNAVDKVAEQRTDATPGAGGGGMNASAAAGHDWHPGATSGPGTAFPPQFPTDTAPGGPLATEPPAAQPTGWVDVATGQDAAVGRHVGQPRPEAQFESDDQPGQSVPGRHAARESTGWVPDPDPKFGPGHDGQTGPDGDVPPAAPKY